MVLTLDKGWTWLSAVSCCDSEVLIVLRIIFEKEKSCWHLLWDLLERKKSEKTIVIRCGGKDVMIRS